MKDRAQLIVSVGTVIVVALCAGFLAGRETALNTALAAETEVSPVKAQPRDFYVPNSEDLGRDEMRVIALGTGMPTPRPAQASASFLVELGNGDKFLFDIGEASVDRLSGLLIPYDYLDKVTPFS